MQRQRQRQKLAIRGMAGWVRLRGTLCWNGVLLGWVPTIGRHGVGYRCLTDVSTDGRLLPTAAVASRSTPCVDGGQSPWGTGSDPASAPSRHARPPNRLACRFSEATSTSSLPATCRLRGTLCWNGVLLGWVPTVGRHGVGYRCLTGVSTDGRLLPTAAVASRSTPCVDGGQSPWGTGSDPASAPSRHARPPNRLACRFSEATSTSSLPATCRRWRARVRPV